MPRPTPVLLLRGLFCLLLAAALLTPFACGPEDGGDEGTRGSGETGGAGAASGDSGDSGDPGDPGAAAPQEGVSQAEAVWANHPERSGLEPAAAIDSSGRQWLAWLNWGEDGSCSLLVKYAMGRKVSDFGVVANRDESIALPVMAPFGQGVYCVWESHEPGAEGLFGRLITAEPAGKPRFGDIEPIAPAGLQPQLVAAGKHSLALVWQVLVGDQYEIYFARRDGGTWSSPRPVTLTEHDEWNPQVARSEQGGLHVAWDRYDGESYDVVHARIKEGQVSGETVVAGGPAYQGYPRMAIDDRDRAWIAYEEAPGFGEGDGLREERVVRLAVVDGERVQHARIGEGDRHDGSFPRVAVGKGGVVMTCRVFGSARPENPGHEDNIYNTWETEVLTFDAEGALATERFPQMEGDNEGTEILMLEESGAAWCAFTADHRSVDWVRTHGFNVPIENKWQVGIVPVPGPTGWPVLGDEPPDTQRTAPPAPMPSWRSTARAPSSPQGGWLYGDLHRHTHLSRCAGRFDGTILDAYRFARGPGQLDFVAITDHFQHLQPWSWWRSLRDVERYHAPGSLVVFAGLERNVPGAGHQNLVYLDGKDAVQDDAAWVLPWRDEDPDEMAAPSQLPVDRVVAIPHMMSSASNPYRWRYLHEGLHRLVEVYQGNRGSYEGWGLPYQAKDMNEKGSDIHRALVMGKHFGFIAAADHRSSASAVTGVRAAEKSRASIFEGLLAMRTFAATDFAQVDLSLGPLRAGERGALPADAAGAPLVLEVGGRLPVDAAGEPVPLAYVEIVKNGATWRRVDGSESVDRTQPWEELFVFTARHGRTKSRGPITVTLTGGRFLSTHRRLEGERRVDVEELSDTEMTVSRHGQRFDMVYRVERKPDEACEFLFRFAEQSAPVEVESLEPGTSFRLFGLNPQLEYLWRMGVPLDQVGGRFTFDDPQRQPEDSYYARVVWVDGSMLWTSPIRVEPPESVEPGVSGDGETR